ncbi:hypothetical protein O9H85_12050 [Paenibacillus filicis]|uniref:ATP-binding protein n=1 Tax=Paenibacillus gyeongsangnamensis TaxID=3388067 RepID=A0ABT4Q8D7_9BACL|nr:hypothetical protein [Paenibacillus filicis]MCZ8513143.1 hypothetical protein [Paenibacillus filicis]
MKIYGLYGKSGTGKSHKSSEVVARYQIDAVIDDGILIMNKMRVAGKSAKNERFMYAATKRAIFFSESHRQEVYNFIKNTKINKMLVIGTSQKMVESIVKRLDLPQEIEWIPIESFQSEEELNLAKARRSVGYHVIPIYPVEVEKTYHGWFSKQVIRLGQRKEEVTLVKPLYYKNKITIDPQCVRDLVSIAADPILQIHSVKVDKEKVFISLSLQQGYTIESLRQWRNHLISILNNSLGIPYDVDVEWRAILPAKQAKGKITKFLNGL